MRISDWSSDVCSSDLLVLQMASRDTGALEGAHRMLGIESVAVTGVRVSDHRDIDGIDDRLEPADDLGQAHQPQVGYAHATGHAAAGDVDRREARLLDEAGRERSEGRRGGKECVRQCRSRWSPLPYKKKSTSYTTARQLAKNHQ